MKLLLGTVVMTRGVEDLHPTEAQLVALLARHQAGDWGDVSDEDKKSNDEAVEDGYRVLSAYQLNGVKIWIITEADRSATTFLLPEEY
jgi:hypothetical protein